MKETVLERMMMCLCVGGEEGLIMEWPRVRPKVSNQVSKSLRSSYAFDSIT